MAGDMMLLMRGLAKLSQAVMETQTNTLRSGTGEFCSLFLNTPHLPDDLYFDMSLDTIRHFGICFGATGLMAFTELQNVANALNKITH